MIPGLSGSLLSHDALADMIRSGSPPELTREPPLEAMRAIRSLYAAIHNRLGPSGTSRSVFDLVADPLARALGFRIIPTSARDGTVEAILEAHGVTAAFMIVTGWGVEPDTVWRQAVHRGLAHGVRWCLCFNGPAIRLIDAGRAYARRYAELRLETTLDSPPAAAVMWALLQARAPATAPFGTILERAIAHSESHRAQVRRSLRHGVHQALLLFIQAFRRGIAKRHSSAKVLDESLVVVYRILFLLFAEARGLVPTWHPVYREGYTIEALRPLPGPGPSPLGVWEALQAVARLAHRGCHAGTLRVPPFNGRLFSPADAPLADTVPLDDRVVSRALAALTVRQGGGAPQAISYADLGVEQLGAVYEHLLDFDLAAPAAAPPALVPSGRRKATGSFYTPRSLTEFLVRRTLAPLVRDAPPERILAVRVLDPSMGSGAFLVAACRYLATAYEHALVRDGSLSPSDIGDDDRAAFRRLVAQNCLFGVDVNPMAVHLARLSLWLATLAADRPLSFLDHRLRSGNSLVGASIEDIVRNPTPGFARHIVRDLPLFPHDAFQSSFETAVLSRRSIADTPDDTLEQVKDKERRLAVLNRRGGPLDRWRSAGDVWCAAWYPEGRRASSRPLFQSLLDEIIQGSSALPRHVADALLAEARQAAEAQAFFHWPLEFPEVFYDPNGRPRADAGFDAIVGNPPWEMLRDRGGAAGTAQLHAFARTSGAYRLQGRGHVNLYQLFLERIVWLLRRGGRAGLILPAGVATDRASAPLRRHLFDRTSIDTFTTLDNRNGIFPIHRALRFLLLGFTNDGSTPALPARAGIRSADVLDAIGDDGIDPDAIRIPRTILDRIDPETLAVPEFRSQADLDIVSMVSSRLPALGDRGGWGVHFGRELNATDDRPHFRDGDDGLPVLEGKRLRPFAVDTMSARCIPEPVAATLLDAATTYRRARLGYRDVASPGNRTTLIAAIVPAGVVTTHTIFCLKERLDAESQQFLCGVFNSYVANYLVRMRVGTHVTAAIVARLPVPKPARDDRLFREVARLSRALSRRYTEPDAARLNALVAVVYGLTTAQFTHVLRTFPLVPQADRAAALKGMEPLR